jgi:hypothetical protein
MNQDAVLVGLLVILLPALNWWQNRRIAKATAAKAEKAAGLLAANTTVANDKLDEIHMLVNSRLSDALQTIEDLKALLLLVISAEVAGDDPRVKDAITKNS